MKQGIYIEVTPFFPTNNCFRGAFVYDQVKALKRTNRFDEILVFRPKSILDKANFYVYDDIKVYLFPCIESPSYIMNGIFDSINKILFKNWFHSNFEFSINDIKIVHAHVSTFGIYPLLLKEINHQIKTIIQHHDLDPFTIRNGKWADKYWNLKYKYKRNKRVFEQIDYHLCVSDKVKDSLLAFPQPRFGEVYQSYLSKLKLIESLPKTNIKNALILYNGVDTNIFFPKLKSTHSIFKIGCIANFVELKDHSTLLKAINVLINEKRYQNIRLSLIGSGPLLDQCKQYVATNCLNDYVTFEPEISHEELSDYYNSLDLFVLPSYFEGFGCVFTEAASCNIPFITCENQGVEAYILEEDREKWLFPAKEPNRLVEVMSRYLETKESQNIAKTFDIDILINNFLFEIQA